MGKPRVDLLRLLEDLRDACDGSLEETILSEIAAHALDSGATHISVRTNAAASTLTVVDDGRGMKRGDLARSHVVAARPRLRGQRIGAASVGIQLALLIADEVTVESRRAAAHVATTWCLATRYRAPWTWIEPPGLTGRQGTAVRLRLSNPLSPLLDVGYLEEAIRTHFAPLLDPAFADLLRRHYSHSIVIDVDGRPISPSRPRIRARVTIPIRMGRKRLPSATATLQRHDDPLPEDQQGIAISTYGRVIKRGWNWLGLSPASAWRVTGMVEAPELAACLTPDRSDFIRSGPRGAVFMAHRKAIRDVVARQLMAWGDSQEGEPRARAVRLERDVERVLEELADDFPLLRSLADQTAGQKPLPLSGRDVDRAEGRRPSRCDLIVQFESRPHDVELGRLSDGTMWINDAHPAYTRAAASRASGYHIALTVALTLAPLVVGPGHEPAFVTRFLTRWAGVRS